MVETETALTPTCPFCDLPADHIDHPRGSGIVVRDAFPVSRGHSVIIPRRHLSSFFEVSDVKRNDLLALLTEAWNDLPRQFRPSGYNIGINDGTAAGQTVQHLRIRLIPRYEGDRDQPRGGIRCVLPDKAAYWEKD